MNVTNGAHLAVGGSCGTRLSKGKREEQGRGRKVISRGLSDREPPWHASSAKMANVIVKLLSYGKYVKCILRVVFGCVATVIVANM